MTDSEHPAEKTAEVDIDRASMTVSQYLAGRDIAARGVEIGPDASRASSHLETEPARKYDVGKFVARGGMGMILSAKDRCIRRHVAMKVMTAKYPPTGDQILRFIEEGQVTGQLEHPNIVPVHELGVDAKGHVFYTMKMVRGHTLKDVLGGLRSGDPDTLCDYSLMHLLSIFQRICDGVAFAHSRGVIHRDLKPENIMLGDFGEVLVMDWGLAKVRGLDTRASDRPAEGRDAVESVRQDDSTKLTMDGMVMGTPCYMAPEQAAGKVREIDERTDIYALGVILYEMLTLHRPVTGESRQALLQKVIHGDIADPMVHSTKARPIPRSAAAVALKALATDPKDRYASVLELSREIQAYQEGFATEAEAASFLRLLVLLVQRHKRELSVVAGALLLLLGAGTAFVWRLSAQRNRALVAEAEATVQRNEAQRMQGVAEDRAAALQRQVAHQNVLTGMQLTDEGDVFLGLLYLTEALRLEQGMPIREQMHRRRIGSLLKTAPRPAQMWVRPGRMGISPDGRTAVFAYPAHPSPTHLAFCDVASGNERCTTEAGVYNGWCRMPGKDAWYALVQTPAGTTILEPRSGRTIPHDIPFPPWIHQAVSSPDGRFLAVASGADVHLLDMSDERAVGQPYTFPSRRKVLGLAFSPDGAELIATTGAELVRWSPTDFTVTGAPEALVSSGRSGPTGSATGKLTGKLAGSGAATLIVADQYYVSLFLHGRSHTGSVMSDMGRRYASTGVHTDVDWSGTRTAFGEPDRIHWEELMPRQTRETRSRHLSGPTGIALDRYGEILATADGIDRAVWLWWARADRYLAKITTPEGVRLTGFSDDSRLLGLTPFLYSGQFSAVWHRPVIPVYPTIDGEIADQTTNRDVVVLGYRVAFDHAAGPRADRRLIVADSEKTGIWDWENGKRLALIPIASPLSNYWIGLAQGAWYLNETATEAIAASTEGLWRWTPEAGVRPIAQRTGKLSREGRVSSNGRFVCILTAARAETGVVDGGELWSVARGVKIAELGRIYGEPATMFSADGKHLLTHGPSAQADDKVSGNEVRVFALDKAPILRVFRTDEQIGRCAITADGSLVAASLVDGNILLLRPDARGLVLADTIEHDVIVDGLIFSADKRILLAESRGNILIWRVDTGKLAGPILSPDFRLQIVRLSHDGTLVAAIGKSALRIWDTRSGEPVTPKLTVPGSILDAAFRADDSRFSVVLTTTVVYSWDLSPVRLPVGQLASLAELLAGESRNQESGIRERLP